MRVLFRYSKIKNKGRENCALSYFLNILHEPVAGVLRNDSMFRMLRKKSRKIHSILTILLVLFQNIAPAFLFATPAFAATDAHEVIVSDIALGFDADAHEFTLTGQTNYDADYTLTYQGSDDDAVEKAVVGSTATGEFEELIYAGTCSKEECVPDEVSRGTLTFTQTDNSAEFAVTNGTLWLNHNGVFTVASVTEDVTYTAPQNDQVTVTFTSLPENPGTLSIQEVILSDEQVEALGALSNVAYDITSSMENGSFEYDLTLPVPDTDKQAKVVFAEDIESLEQGREVASSITDGKATAENLNHFTFFIITDDDAVYSAPWIDYATQGYLNTGVHYPTNVVAGETATWDFTTVTPGTYKVFISWSTHSNRTTAAPYVLTHASSTEARVINQEQLADQATTGASAQWSNWYYYGEYSIDGSSNMVLTGVDNTSGTDYVIADEIMLTNMASAPTHVWVDDDYVLNGPNDGHVWGYDAFATVEAGLAAVAATGMVDVKNGTYVLPSTLNVNKAVTINGESEAGVVLNASAFTTSYGIHPSADNVTLKNFTLLPPSNAYPIHVSSTPGLVLNLALENITIDAAKKTPFDIHGVDGGTLTNLTATNTTSGNGMSLTGSSNLTVEGITTQNNAWGGIALYNSKYTSPNRPTSDITLLGATFTQNEANPLYAQNEFAMTITGIDAQAFDYIVRNPDHRPGGDEFVFYQKTLPEAKTFALSLQTAGIPNTSSTIETIAGDHFYVYDTMEIQRAVDGVSADGIVDVDAGTYQEQVVIAKNLELLGTGTPKILSVDSPRGYKVAESSKTFEPIVFMYGGTLGGDTVTGGDQISVTFDGFDVDGNDRSTASGVRPTAVLARNTLGTLSGNTIHNMHVGSNETFGILVYGASDLQITDNSVTEYARGGIAISGDNGAAPDPTASVRNNNVFGPANDHSVIWAPNGIQVGYGATGIVEGNTVTGNGWPGSAWSGTGILIVDTSSVEVRGNTVQENEQAIGVVDFPEAIYGPAWSGVVSYISILDNTVNNNSWGLAIANEATGIDVMGNSFSNIEGDAVDVYTYSGAESTPPRSVTVSGNSIELAGGDGLWVGSAVTEEVTAVRNWWGDVSGPSGDGPGSGQTVSGNAAFCPWLTTSDLNNPTYGGDCLGYIQGRTFIDKANNGLLLTADGDYPDGMEDDFTVRLYDSSWNVLDEQTTRTTSKVGQYYFSGLLDEGNTYRVCGVQRTGYVESLPALGQHPVKTNGGAIPSQYSDAVIVTNASSATDEFSACWETTLNDDTGAYLGVGFTHANPSTPEYLGFNQQGTSSLTEVPPYLSCGVAVNGSKKSSGIWTDVSGSAENVKYIRHNQRPGGLNDILLGQSSRVTLASSGDANNESILATLSDDYDNFYSGWGTFGGNEGLYKTRVRAYSDLNSNNKYDTGEPLSDWSNFCEVTYDKTVPVTNLTSPTDNTQTNSEILIEGSSSDDSKVAEVNLYYSVAGADNWQLITTLTNTAGDEPYTFSYHWTPSAEGTYDIKAAGTDVAGNVENSAYVYAVVFDTTAPVVTWDNPADTDLVEGVVPLTAICDGGTTESTYVNFWWWKASEGQTIIDARDGAPKQYNRVARTSLNGGTVIGNTFSWDLDTANEDSIQSAYDWTGEWKLRAACKDAAGNYAQSELTVSVDNVKPESIITTYDLADGGEVETASFSGLIEGTATDDNSGVDHVLLSISHLAFGADEVDTEYWDATASAWVATESTFRATGTDTWSYQLTDVPEGIYNVTSHAVDKSGNVESTYTIKIVYDKTIPQVVLTIDPAVADGDNGWYRAVEPKVTLTASDNYSLDHIEYQWNSTTGTWVTYSTALTAPSQGQNILYYRSIDTVGNVSDVGVKEVKYDPDKPEGNPLSVRVENITSTEADGLWEAPTDDGDVSYYRLSWKHEDGTEHGTTVSRDTFEQKLDQLKDGLWTFKVQAVDAAGNYTQTSVDFRVGPAPDDGAVLGTATEDLAGGLGTGGVLGARTVALDATDETTDEQSPEESGQPQDEDGEVLGASTCSTWAYYLPLILLVLQLLSIVGFELLRREPGILKQIVVAGITIVVVGLFYIFKDVSCYVDGSWLAVISKWFIGLSALLSVVTKLIAYGFIEEA